MRIAARVFGLVHYLTHRMLGRSPPLDLISPIGCVPPSGAPSPYSSRCQPEPAGLSAQELACFAAASQFPGIENRRELYRRLALANMVPWTRYSG